MDTSRPRILDSSSKGHVLQCSFLCTPPLWRRLYLHWSGATVVPRLRQGKRTKVPTIASVPLGKTLASTGGLFGNCEAVYPLVVRHYWPGKNSDLSATTPPAEKCCGFPHNKNMDFPSAVRDPEAKG